MVQGPTKLYLSMVINKNSFWSVELIGMDLNETQFYFFQKLNSNLKFFLLFRERISELVV